MNQTIFREYDVRGLVDKELDNAFVWELGRAIGTLARTKGITKMSVGRDCRLSSERFAALLQEGLAATGINVIDIGLCATPMLYFSIHHWGLGGGVMVTGSHNPPEFNGFKICIGKETIYGEEIQNLRKLMLAGEYSRGNGGISSISIVQDYSERLLADVKIEKGMKVALDGGNGVGGKFILPLLQECGCEVLDIYCEPDGNFPNHFPDPTIEENLTALISLVRQENAELGIAFDGDADRLGAVTGRGEIVWGDLLLALFARSVLDENPGATIIGEVKCSQRLFADIVRNGGNAIMWKAGHSLIKGKMKESGALLAGEMSGHMFFADRYYGYDDAIYAALRLLELISRTGKSLAEMALDFPPAFATPEIRQSCQDEIKFAVVEKAKEILAKRYDVNTIDGVRATFDGGWGLLRASNTQPVLVMRFEASSHEKLQRISADFQETLAELLR